MAVEGTDVCNNPLDTSLNKFTVADFLVGGKKYQCVIPCDSNGNPGVTPGTPTALTPGAPSSAVIGTISSIPIAANANRKALVIQNKSISGQIIFLAHGTTALINKGEFLYPGGTFTMDQYSFDLLSVTAIASATNAILTWVERT